MSNDQQDSAGYKDSDYEPAITKTPVRQPSPQQASYAMPRYKPVRQPSPQQASYAMPRYKCHKEVHAGKITQVKGTSPGYEMVLEDNGIINMPVEWMMKNKPQVGGYYVRYDDGYESYSPAKAFEEGYTLMQRTTMAEDVERAKKHMEKRLESPYGWGERIKLLEATVSLHETQIATLIRQIAASLPDSTDRAAALSAAHEQGLRLR